MKTTTQFTLCRCLAAVLLLTSVTLTIPMSPVAASSHREAPAITLDPTADNTDVYAFVSYEEGRGEFVTLISNFIPLEDAAAGPNFHRFNPGVLYEEPASFELKEIAENGNNAPLLDFLGADSRVSTVLQAGPPPLVPSADPGGTGFPDSVTFTITANQGAQYLSFASMLICTNDGFTGVDSLHLPKRVGESVTVFTNGYDAGTEINTEDFADIVPPCQGLIGVSSNDDGTGASDPELAEGGVIAGHPGIVGGVDLIPGTHGWMGSVTQVEIERAT